MTTIGFIGAGQMAQALVSGICSADSSIKFEIADPSTASKDAFQQKVSSPVQVRTDNAELFAACDIVFLSIKPQYFDDAVNFNDVQTAVAKAPRSPLVVSIMAGVTLKKIAEVTGLERIVRVMPNTPSLIMEGAAGLAPSPEVTDQELNRCKTYVIGRLRHDGVRAIAGRRHGVVGFGSGLRVHVHRSPHRRRRAERTATRCRARISHSDGHWIGQTGTANRRTSGSPA
jgi:hypothetical protein